MLVHRMELVHHRLGIRVVGLVKLHGVPAILAPVLPVLDQGVHGKLALAELSSNVQDLFLGVIAFPALPVSIHPLGKHRRFAGELAVVRDDLIQCRTIKEVVINGLPHLGAESGRVFRRTRGQLKASGASLGGDLILLVRLQIHHTGCRTRCPHVHQINHVLPVHIHYQLILVVAGQQEAVAPFRSRTELSLAGGWINGNGFDRLD